MKNVHFIIMAVILMAAISLTGLSCKKEQKAAVPPPPTPEQKAQIEEIKKEFKKSTEEAKAVTAAQVNGVDITMHDLVNEMNTITQREEAQGKGKKPKTTEVVRKEALDNLIFKELAVQESIKQGIVVSPERVDTVVQLMKKQMGSEEAYKKYLDDLSLTDAELRKRIERSQRIEMITGKEIYQKVKIDDKDVRADYEKNKSEYKDSSGRQLSYEEAANFIRRKLISKKGAELKKAWAKTLEKNASVVVFKEAKK